MLEPPALGLRIVDATTLDRRVRKVLRPGETLADARGVERRLPRFFYEVPSWEAALETRLTAHFGVWELLDTDIREAPVARAFPRYVPCAVVTLAAHLQLLRSELGRVIRVAANGGYRSPAHRHSRVASCHLWGAAANIYRIGDEWLDNRDSIEKFREVARRVVPGAWTRPFGTRAGYAFDHLHIDIGYCVVEPHGDSPGTGAHED